MAARVRVERSALVASGAISASLIGHVGLALLGAWLVRASLEQAPRDPSAGVASASDEVLLDPSPLDLPSMAMSESAAVARPSPERVAEPAVPGGGEPLPRPDTGRAGRGGSAEVDVRALNLADRDDAIALSREVTSRIDRDQIQRLHTAESRESFEDRRSTTHPMDLVFLASGAGKRQERRPVAKRDPSAGALSAPAAGVVGSQPGGNPLPSGGLEPPRVAGGPHAGADHASPGTGVLGGAPGDDHRVSAAVAHGRPMVAEGPPSIPSNRDGRPRDDVDAEQEVSSTIQSILHASTAGGLEGAGRGGEPGPGPTGSGGSSGPGSDARPLGGGPGAYQDLSGDDPRLSGYRRAVIAKLSPLWEHAFPKSAALEGKQGRAIIGLVIVADGSVHDVQVVRSSGVPEFDANVRAAVLRGAPFGALPPELHARSMRWTISFDAMNPAVR